LSVVWGGSASSDPPIDAARKPCGGSAGVKEPAMDRAGRLAKASASTPGSIGAGRVVMAGAWDKATVAPAGTSQPVACPVGNADTTAPNKL
jgi:hypothetical protein